MIKIPYANGAYRAVFEAGDKVRVQIVVLKQPCDFIGTVMARNESIEPGKFYYRVTGHNGWIYEPNVSEVPAT